MKPQVTCVIPIGGHASLGHSANKEKIGFSVIINKCILWACFIIRCAQAVLHCMFPIPTPFALCAGGFLPHFVTYAKINAYRFYTLQDFMPEELYSKDNLNRQFETELAHLQNDFYPNSQELELESQPGEVWRSI